MLACHSFQFFDFADALLSEIVFRLANSPVGEFSVYRLASLIGEPSECWMHYVDAPILLLIDNVCVCTSK